MKLEFYQNKISEVNITTNKEKYQPYFFCLLGLNSSISNIEEILTFNFTNTEKLITELSNSLFYSIKLLADFDSKVNTDEFNLENYKNNIRTHQVNGVNIETLYLKQSRLALGKINLLVKDSIGSGGEFDLPVKTYLIKYLLEVITKLFLLTDYCALNIDVLLEKSLNNLGTNSIKKDSDKKTKEK